jgi:hypothetical protein
VVVPPQQLVEALERQADHPGLISTPVDSESSFPSPALK